MSIDDSAGLPSLPDIVRHWLDELPQRWKQNGLTLEQQLHLSCFAEGFSEQTVTKRLTDFLKCHLDGQTEWSFACESRVGVRSDGSKSTSGGRVDIVIVNNTTAVLIEVKAHSLTRLAAHSSDTLLERVRRSDFRAISQSGTSEILQLNPRQFCHHLDTIEQCPLDRLFVLFRTQATHVVATATEVIHDARAQVNHYKRSVELEGFRPHPCCPVNPRPRVVYTAVITVFGDRLVVS
jgi:hypothetical protein